MIDNDVSAAQQAAEGLLLILSAFSPIPAGIVAGITGLASAAGYFFGVKHADKRARKAADKEDLDLISGIINSKDGEEHA